MLVIQTPQTAQTAHEQYHGVRATTSWLQRYTRLPPASRAGRLPAEQEATPHACGSISALYYCCGFLFSGCFCYRTLRSVGLRVSAAVRYMHAATGTTTQIFS